jgi:hypothetical protein
VPSVGATCCCFGALGLPLAQWAMSALAFGADLIPRILEIRIDLLALGFSLLVTLLTGLAIGLLPALQASSVNVLEALKEAGRGSIGSGNRLRAGLLIAEVSLSLVVHFLPALQRPEQFTNILVRTNLGPAAMAPLVRDALRAVDPELPLLQPQALTTRIAQTVANREMALVLLGGFAALALLLASLGVSSVMAHLVTFRTSDRDRGLDVARVLREARFHLTSQSKAAMLPLERPVHDGA